MKHLELIKKYEQPQQNGEIDPIDEEEQSQRGSVLRFFQVDLVLISWWKMQIFIEYFG